MKRALMGVVFGGLLCMAANPSRADVIYDFTPSNVDYHSDHSSYISQIFPASKLGFTLQVKDSAFDKGSFDLHGSGPGYQSYGSVSFTGDAGNFISFGSYEGYVTPSHLVGSLDISLKLSSAGDVIKGEVRYRADDSLLLNINNNAVSGSFGPDYSNAGDIAVSGTLTHRITDVPEPASMALLGMGLLGVGAVRRRSGRAA